MLAKKSKKLIFKDEIQYEAFMRIVDSLKTDGNVKKAQRKTKQLLVPKKKKQN